MAAVQGGGGREGHTDRHSARECKPVLGASAAVSLPGVQWPGRRALLKVYVCCRVGTTGRLIRFNFWDTRKDVGNFRLVIKNPYTGL